MLAKLDFYHSQISSCVESPEICAIVVCKSCRSDVASWDTKDAGERAMADRLCPCFVRRFSLLSLVETQHQPHLASKRRVVVDQASQVVYLNLNEMKLQPNLQPRFSCPWIILEMVQSPPLVGSFAASSFGGESCK